MSKFNKQVNKSWGQYYRPTHALIIRVPTIRNELFTFSNNNPGTRRTLLFALRWCTVDVLDKQNNTGGLIGESEDRGFQIDSQLVHRLIIIVSC